MRIVHNYRLLNSVTISNHYALPLISDLPDHSQKSCIFTKLDLRDYNLISMEKGHENLTVVFLLKFRWHPDFFRRPTLLKLINFCRKKFLQEQTTLKNLFWCITQASRSHSPLCCGNWCLWIGLESRSLACFDKGRGGFFFVFGLSPYSSWPKGTMIFSSKDQWAIKAIFQQWRYFLEGAAHQECEALA